jgi:glycosyltransferase involved in cell wall biosynthesis
MQSTSTLTLGTGKRANNRIAFVSNMDDYAWGGSEELWSRAALQLAAQGYEVSASVVEWLPPHRRLRDLIEKGIDVWFRPKRYSLLERALRKARSDARAPIVAEVEKMILAHSPALVVFSAGGPYPWFDLMELCIEKRMPFVTIGQANWEGRWLLDEHARRHRKALAEALRCYFVSHANMRLAEKHLGGELHNGEVVWNPFNIDYDISLPWPQSTELRLACVARLDPSAKGQDLLLEALTDGVWRERDWRLELYGEGGMKHTLRMLVDRLGLSDRVGFAGHRSVREIWATNHALVMPSRHEGMPLAMVEALLCARPVLATDVAGHADIVEDGVNGFLAEAPTASHVAVALERLWAGRARLEEMGRAGATKIRELVPRDPAQAFAEKIKGHLRAPLGVRADIRSREAVQ